VSLHLPASASSTLQEFRERLHGCISRRADARFDSCDTILTTGTVRFPAQLSPYQRRPPVKKAA
jgi:hypothetical protein